MTKDTSNDTIIMNRRSDNNDDPPTVAITSEKPNAEYPGTGRTIFTVISLLLGVFLVSSFLNRSIYSTSELTEIIVTGRFRYCKLDPKEVSTDLV